MATIAVDFDGVIHAYSKGWHDGTIYDEPLPGALDGLRMLMEHAAVFIHTTRDAGQVARWLIERGFSTRTGDDGPFWNERRVLLITNRKLAAVAYLDDRAVRFTGWDHAVDDTLLAAGIRPEPPTAGVTMGREAGQRKVTITSEGPYKTSAVVGGVDLTPGLTGLALTMGVGQIPQLTLDVQLIDVTRIQDIDAQVLVSPASHDVLVALGWTPPHDTQPEPSAPDTEASARP